MDVTTIRRDMIRNKADKTSGSKFDFAETTRYEGSFASVFLATNYYLWFRSRGQNKKLFSYTKKQKKHFLASWINRFVPNAPFTLKT